MPIKAKDFTTMVDEALQNLINSTAITSTAADSRARILLELPLSQLNTMWQELELLERNSFLSTADGVYLDAIGEIMGVRRLPAQKSSSFIRFYRSSSGSLVSIPVNTRVYSTSDPELSFYTTHAVSIGLSDLEAFAQIQANDVGSFYTAGAYALNAHDSIDNSAIRVMNILPITNGADEEDDDNYRFRVSRAIFANAKANADSLRMGLLDIPGVRDVVLRPYARGTGSIDVLIYSYYPTVNDDLLSRVQEELDERLAAFGVKATAVAPDTVTVGVRCTLGFRPDTSTNDRAVIRQNVKNNIDFYLNNLAIGETAYLDQIEKAALNTSEKILEVSIYLVEVDGESRLAENVAVEDAERIITGNILIS